MEQTAAESDNKELVEQEMVFKEELSNREQKDNVIEKKEENDVPMEQNTVGSDSKDLAQQETISNEDFSNFEQKDSEIEKKEENIPTTKEHITAESDHKDLAQQVMVSNEGLTDFEQKDNLIEKEEENMPMKQIIVESDNKNLVQQEELSNPKQKASEIEKKEEELPLGESGKSDSDVIQKEENELMKIVNKITITFQEYDGALVPMITTKSLSDSEEVLEFVFQYLTTNAAEILTQDKSLIVYTKLYEFEEMFENGVEDFHPGYSIRTFFQRFPELCVAIDRENYNSICVFLDEEKERIDDLLEFY